MRLRQSHTLIDRLDVLYVVPTHARNTITSPIQ